MIVPLFLCLVSVIGLALAVVLPGLQDLEMLAGPMLLASLWLLLRAGLARGAGARGRAQPIRPPNRTLRRPRQPGAVCLRASSHHRNMSWSMALTSCIGKDNLPQIETVRAVVDRLTAAGYAPGVVFDANAGHKLMGKYKHDYAFSKLLGLPHDRVMVVAKGTPADPVILASARALGARIVSNDRFRDWAETHPEVAVPGHLIAGGYRDGQVWLDMA